MVVTHCWEPGDAFIRIGGSVAVGIGDFREFASLSYVKTAIAEFQSQNLVQASRKSFECRFEFAIQTIWTVHDPDFTSSG